LPDFARISGWLKKQWADSLVLTGIAFLTGAISEVSYWLLDTFPMLGKIG
jgi:cytochrome c-type biogenesis protein